MREAAEGPPVISLPERFDRRMRFGPFPSSRDAFKFLSYAAAGALLSPFTSPWVWLPLVAIGFCVSVWRPDGRGVDERVLAFAAWKLRLLGVGWMNPPAGPLVRQGLLQLSPHRYLAIVRTGGTPVAYLPPDELARRFELYREMIRSTEPRFMWLASTAPIRAQAVVPVVSPKAETEGRACSGYSELVSLLCRRRLLRRVYFVLDTLDASSEAVVNLEARVSRLIDRLGGLGLRPLRLRDRALVGAARRFGWSPEATGE